MRLFKFFFPIRVTEKVYNNFVNNNQVSEEILRLLALKVIANKPMNQLEMAVFVGKTREINELIIDIKDALNEK